MFLHICVSIHFSHNDVLLMPTNCRKCGPDVQLHLLPFQHGDRGHVEFCFGLLTPRIIVKFGPVANYLVLTKAPLYRHYCLLFRVNLFSRVIVRCFVAEPQRQTNQWNRWRRMWVTVINTPTSWCSAMPANCFQTTKRLFTTSRENILSHGWGTRASWLIGRLNKLRLKHYANHLPCPLACFRIQGTTWGVCLVEAWEYLQLTTNVLFLACSLVFLGGMSWADKNCYMKFLE